MENFLHDKLSKNESRKLEDILKIVKEDYGATVKETPDQVFITVKNKIGQKVTYGFTKVGDSITIGEKQVHFAELIIKTIEEKCQKKLQNEKTHD